MANKKSPDPLTKARGVCKSCGTPISSATAEACVACYAKANSVPVVVWENCFEWNWKGVITKKSFTHPARFAHGLINRIVHFGLEQGFWKKGDLVLDPFGGVGTGGIICAHAGLRWLGVELEPPFHALGQENFAIHQHAWEGMGDPIPRLLLGDSRKLAQVLEEAGALVSSPPYTQATVSGFDNDKPEAVVRKWHDSYRASGGGMSWEKFLESVRSGRRAGMRDYGSSEGQLGAMPTGDINAVLSSPPYAATFTGANAEKEGAAESQAKRRTPGGSLGQAQRHGGYGMSEGNLSNMPEGVISSPPYAETQTRQTHEGNSTGRQVRRDGKAGGTPIPGCYGTTEGQLGAMPQGDPSAVVSSPPYEEGLGHGGKPTNMPKDTTGSRKAQESGYGGSEGQGGQMAGQTFWEASRLILEQCHAVLRPGAVAAWNVKDFVRKGERVCFCDQWARLCEACGFKVFLRVHALLSKTDSHPGLFEPEVKQVRERKSFFRRLHESKPGAVKIDFEEVLFARRVP